MSATPTISLSELLAGADAAGHDHAATEKNSGLQHIHNHATGSIVWFPTWKKFRETTDWSEAVDGVAVDVQGGDPGGCHDHDIAVGIGYEVPDEG